MGQFSWMAQDTNKSISNITPSPVTMTDNKGNKWQENDYEGYGVFGGKDFYELLAEMNDLTGREEGIHLYFGKKAFLSPNLNEDNSINWENRIPNDCPDQGWT